ncbi:MAG: hypothetical protein FJZ00_13310 [Candidatus Sericytochromatia bacterium]|uniref:Uncharacterized protein n=1 Tax=Candidatus Tanganyikabacteria bacterium TaxID=2961651 RepID=A0A938BPD7_9BACT|nr:hypothetical protein [Candidatus Tanganyikabacteria bacterium]
MQNGPDLRLPPPKQTVKMDLSALMKEVLADVPLKNTRSTGALPPEPIAAPIPTKVPAPAPLPLKAAMTQDLSLVEFDELYTHVYGRFRNGLGLNARQSNALRHAGFALAIGGLVDGDGESVLRFLNRVRERVRTHIAGHAGYRLPPVQIKLLGQVFNTFRSVA